MEETMTPTLWEIRNKLLAILSAAKHSGKPFVDIDSGNLQAESGGDSNASLQMPICQDVMTRMMRPGDLILKDTSNEDVPRMLIRYLLDAKHEN
jgi:hypothetical protein